MTEIHIRGEFVRPLHMLSVRGWLGAPRPPVSVRLMRGESALEATDCFIERTDVRPVATGDRAFGFWMALVTGNEPTGLSVEVVLDTGEIVLSPVERLNSLDDVSYAMPEALAGTDLGEGDQVKVARGFLEMLLGNRVWLNFLRQHGVMRHLIRRDHNGLAQDVKWSHRSEAFIADLLTQIFSDPNLAKRVDINRLREHALRLVRTAAPEEVVAAPLTASDHLKELYALVAQGQLDPEATKAFGDLVSLGARKGYVDALLGTKHSFRRNLLSALSRQTDATPLFKAAVDGLDSQLLPKTIAGWDKKGNFDDVLTRNVLADSGFPDRLTEQPELVGRLLDEPKVASLIAGHPKTVSRVISLMQAGPASKAAPLPTVEGDILFSVVLGVYNGAEYLQETLDSILAQSYSNFELIAVDDQSSDETPTILADYAKRDKRIRIVRHPVNLGQAAAMNTGVMQSAGHYVAFMDADDLWFPQKLAETAAFLKGNPEVHFFQHNLYLLFGNVPSKKLFRATLASGDFIQQMQELGASLPGPFTPTAGLVLSREVLMRIMPIPISLRTCSDGYVTRAAAALTPVVSYSKPLGLYRLHGDNATIGNPLYDVSAYAERVLTPAVQSFYDTLETRIWLGNTSSRPDVRMLTAMGGQVIGKPAPIDHHIRSAVAFVATGVEPPVPFSKTLHGFLVSCGLAVENSDFNDLFQNIFPRRGLNGEDDAIAAAIECHMRMLVGDFAVGLKKLDVLMERVPDSTVVASMRLRALEARHDERHRLAAVLQTDIVRGLMTDIHIDAVYAQFTKDNNPTPYLQSQAALASALNLNTAYFANTRWLWESAQTVDAWREEIRSNGKNPRLFAARRAKPPAAVKDMIPEQTGAVHIDEDWRRTCAIDLAGATIFSGEWAIRSSEGMVLADLMSGTPHHRGSMYGQIGQQAASANLLYPEKVREIGPCFVVGSDDNYFHWINDALPRLFWYAKADYPAEMKALMGVLQRPFQKQTLAALGIAEDRCLFLDYPDVVKADRAIIPLVGPQNRTFRPVYGPIRKAVHDQFAAAMVEGYRTDPWGADEQGTRLYVRRAVGTHRSVINEAELEKLFADEGWVVFEPVGKTVAEQIAAFNSASIVVASHGAALANLGFCRAATQVYEMAFPDWSPPYFSTISQGRGLHHRTLYLRSVPSFTRSPSFNNGFCETAMATRIARQAGTMGRWMFSPTR